jgi:hypothetical protein
MAGLAADAIAQGELLAALGPRYMVGMAVQAERLGGCVRDPQALGHRP